MTIRQLSPHIINQIAAGEVIERPASVVKELVENAIDAGAVHIDVEVADGGLSLIRVIDDGSGMSAEDLEMAVERHATSKLEGDRLFAISSLGFRGEALPSIGSIAKLRIESRDETGPGFAISVHGGVKAQLKPAGVNKGTSVEVRDLFYATPARLKFQKSQRAEVQAINDVMKRLALAHSGISFRFHSEGRRLLSLPGVAIGDKEGVLQRLGKVMGADFVKDALYVRAERDELAMEGYAALPTLNRANNLLQYFFVNGRSIKDKQILGAIRAAYRDYLPNNRHPLLSLYLTLPASMVDVNVHPAKSEVRFEDPGLVRGLLIGALRQAIEAAGFKASARGGQETLSAFQAERPGGLSHGGAGGSERGFSEDDDFSLDGRFQVNGLELRDSQAPLEGVTPSGRVEAFTSDVLSDEANGPADAHPLGAARAQLFENYIVSQTDDTLFIVDAHAAHERIVYERLKARLLEGQVPSQGLLIPQIVELKEPGREGLLAHANELEYFGLSIEAFGPGAVAVQAVPGLLINGDIEALVKDLADEIEDLDEVTSLKERLDHVCATMACHGSVRSGRRLAAPEMDALLREMEATPGSGQCNHGRPTYVELKLKDIERLFGR